MTAQDWNFTYMPGVKNLIAALIVISTATLFIRHAVLAGEVRVRTD